MNIRHEAGKTQFLLGEGWPGKKADRVAARHGAVVIRYTDPRGHRRHWYEVNNYGQDVRYIAVLIERDMKGGRK